MFRGKWRELILFRELNKGLFCGGIHADKPLFSLKSKMVYNQSNVHVDILLVSAMRKFLPIMPSSEEEVAQLNALFDMPEYVAPEVAPSASGLTPEPESAVQVEPVATPVITIPRPVQSLQYKNAAAPQAKSPKHTGGTRIRKPVKMFNKILYALYMMSLLFIAGAAFWFNQYSAGTVIGNLILGWCALSNTVILAIMLAISNHASRRH